MYYDIHQFCSKSINFLSRNICWYHYERGYEVLIKIIKTSEYYIECYNQEMNGITSVIQWFVLKQRYTYRILTEHSHALSCIYKKVFTFCCYISLSVFFLSILWKS